MQREEEEKRAAIRQTVEESLDLDEVLRDMAEIGAMMEEEEEEEEEEESGDEKTAGKKQEKGSLQEEYISLRQAYRQMDEEREQQSGQSMKGGVMMSMEMFPEGQGDEDVISLKRPEPVQSVDEMLGVRPIDRESNVGKRRQIDQYIFIIIIIIIIIITL